MRAMLIVGVMLVAVAHAQSEPSTPARVRVTQRDLVPLCLNETTVAEGVRSWDLPPGPVTLTMSMRTNARPGQAGTDAGTAAISFTIEAGHRYEVEVRAEPMAFSTRAWRRHEWTPVVRDRTTDRVVSSEPVWVETSCASGD